MGVFISYSSRDGDAVRSLTQDLQDADEQVWLDQRLGGGDAWWRAILEQIRSCDVFVFALSQNSIQSKPCQAELHYAQTLGLPILPVQVGPVDSMQLNPLASVQTVDYRNPAGSTGMRLLAALHRARTQRQPLPSPLPDEPPVPFEYLIRLYTTIAGPDQLSPRDQAALVAQLEVGLREDGGHDAARNDIVTLLNKLRDREDVTYRTRTDVDTILASLDSEPRPEPGPQPPNLTATDATTTLGVSTGPAIPHHGPDVNPTPQTEVPRGDPGLRNDPIPDQNMARRSGDWYPKKPVNKSGAAAAELPSARSTETPRRRKIRIAVGVTLLASAAILIVLSYVASMGRYQCPPGTHYNPTYYDTPKGNYVYPGCYPSGIDSSPNPVSEQRYEVWVGPLGPGPSEYLGPFVQAVFVPALLTAGILLLRRFPIWAFLVVPIAGVFGFFAYKPYRFDGYFPFLVCVLLSTGACVLIAWGIPVLKSKYRAR